MPGPTRPAALAALLLAAGIAAVAARPDDPQPAPAAPVASVSVQFAKVWDHKSFAAVREAPGSVELAWTVKSLIGFTPAEIGASRMMSRMP